ncbi:MAG TPA: hypothetical protein VGR34_06440 [Candidatus Dormibacteraeota bacterium]|nr:hypothetical protein [Candidatus Dormibacteraeota bacterium]
MRNRAWAILCALGLGAGILAAAGIAPPKPQQLLFQAQATLPSGEHVSIFLPTIPIGIAVQSKSGSRVLTIGELVHCRPIVESMPMLRKAANGDLEPFNMHEMLLNCGPPAPGEPDRIMAIVGIQWRDN